MKNNFIFINISSVFTATYIYYVFRTPGSVYNNSSPYWEVGRICIFLFWLSFIYYFRWKSNIENAWSPINLLLGCFFGGGFLYFVIAYFSHWVHPVVGIASSSAFLSGLFASPSKSYMRAIFMGFSCFILQGLIHNLVFIWSSYVT